MYLSVDGGGSRLRLLLADSDLMLINVVERGGVNTNFVSALEARNTINEAVEQCISNGIILHNVSYTLLCPSDFLKDALKRKAEVIEFSPLLEGEAGLLAGTGRYKGFAALSGTGSNVSFIGNNINETIGGWGMLLGDEGSGYDIGQKGLKAAIQEYDGRGKNTRLFELLLKRWSILPESFFPELCKRVYGSCTPRNVIAAFATVVGEAACSGDKVAAGIYEQAGHDIAFQIIT